MYVLLFGIIPNIRAQDNPDVSAGKHPTVALVLAGGSAWGIAHIGVIKVIEELGIPVDIVVGTSIGSIVGGLYAAGYTAAEIEQAFVEADWGDLFFDTTVNKNEPYYRLKEKSRYALSIPFDRTGFFLGSGLLSGNKIVRLVDSYLLCIPSPIDFDDLPRRFRTVAADINSGDKVVFSKGYLADAMRASMSLPAIFTPWHVDGRDLVDGGVVDNLPINLAREMGADIIIAVDLVDRVASSQEASRNNFLENFMKTMHISSRENVKPQLNNADVLLTVDVSGFMQTAFDKGVELSAIGEKTARSNISQLQEIRSQFPEDSTNFTGKPDMPSLNLRDSRSVRVEGAVEKDRQKISSILASLSEQEQDGAITVERLFYEIDNTGRYESARIYRDSLEPGNPLLIRLTPKPQEKNAVRLHIVSRTTFSSFNTRNMDLVPAVIVRGLPTKKSQITLDVEILDAPGVDLQFRQGFGDYFSVTPYFTVKQQSSIRFNENYLGYQYNTFFVSGGVNIGISSSGGLEFGAGWSYDYANTKNTFDTSIFPDSTTNNNMVKVSLGLQRVDSPIFAAEGFSGTLDFASSIHKPGSDLLFHTLESGGVATIPFGSPFSMALRWKAGTDFSFLSDVNKAPFYYLPGLTSRWMFPGPLTTEEIVGSNVAGLGLEAQYRIDWRSQSITIPSFIILQGAAGAVIQDMHDFQWNEVFHWNAAVGAGVRLNDAFGILLRGGIHQGTDNRISPFFALDIGAIGF
uniref:Patatin-like phospholipase family protein n=2 Tax=Breznakiella homolactica TaxID=2798577 RepID=A0A7T8BDE6_9SPIR